jgi:tyrosinase
MAIIKFLITTLGLASATLAIPAYPVEPRAICANPVLRKEWSAATASERASYTKAVLCLATKKSKLGLKSTLYDDFPWVHNQLFNQGKSPMFKYDTFVC